MYIRQMKKYGLPHILSINVLTFNLNSVLNRKQKKKHTHTQNFTAQARHCLTTSCPVLIKTYLSRLCLISQIITVWSDDWSKHWWCIDI